MVLIRTESASGFIFVYVDPARAATMERAFKLDTITLKRRNEILTVRFGFNFARGGGMTGECGAPVEGESWRRLIQNLVKQKRERPADGKNAWLREAVLETMPAEVEATMLKVLR